ncbi:acyl carrier protein [Oleisolibacter albus]|uniref:acyl carrier protein n=1 Tax=Oleisolibacter albus TaxID=2171757 RepID=UPI000DF11536|nr:acyl carrier protein [Oleisolibacter albus]
MTEQQIYDGLTAILRDVFDDDGLVARPELSARDVPGWDSFNHINVIVAAELRFGVKFKASELDGLHTLGDFARLIARRKAAA